MDFSSLTLNIIKQPQGEIDSEDTSRRRLKFADPEDNRQNENINKGHESELRHTQTG
jgi:hypothetical protein